ncbi:acetoacetate--CoA ligase [Aurantimonas sp. VKM B-3413]|uniref:acetoacetate--CoA ligase n=1 Tax=Aurantimonas sp. VKM B-3413 TaxID=2779401 RepID=UPI001E2B777F|nr:acetoacetate--CoA ligase [Aurantimonas sp. VKM B-3413]MCB8837591.1 acetoacetate--CoA ligase [Aurantimonas sp. VKM B-3413]
MGGKLLWTPSEAYVEAQPLTRFARAAADLSGQSFPDYATLHRWSIEDRAGFWSAVWDFCGVVGEKGDEALLDAGSMRADRFFPRARLNFAENLLGRPGRGDGDAIVFRGEDKVARRLSWDELTALVSRFAQAFRAEGVGAGDRIAAMMPNMPETIAAMLACASIGAVWSSCSPDFGERGVLDRFGQIEPKLLITCDGYYYAGKTIDIADKLAPIAEKLKVGRTIIAPYLGKAGAVAGRVSNGVALEDFLRPFEPAELEFERLPFRHPLYILFSSGTTGVPKCIVHSAGGTLIQHLKEHQLHCGIEPGARVFYFTTCGWMMWNWLVSGLASGATLLLYDGSPFHPRPEVIFDFMAEEKATFFGTSAKFIDTARKTGVKPIDTHDLSSVRVIASTGSPLSPESFDYVYEAVKPDVHLASVSGGTDIVSCFVLGVPWLPVYEGEIQGPGLGMAVDVWNAEGCPVRGEKGDLVCTKAFPSMPVEFFNDPGGERYEGAYFAEFPGIWAHGDFAEWTEHGGIVIHGRSDATLNPQGVRIGTAEIYNIVEQFPEVAEAICIGQSWEGDVRVLLFVRLAGGTEFSDDLVTRIKQAIRTGASPRHVPAKILAVKDIPRTKSGKITELAVREVVEGRPVKNKEALANPEALREFEGRGELSS